MTLDLEERKSVQDLDLEERKSVQDEGGNPPPNSDTCESEPEHNRIFVRPR